MDENLSFDIDLYLIILRSPTNLSLGSIGTTEQPQVGRCIASASQISKMENFATTVNC